MVGGLNTNSGYNPTATLQNMAFATMNKYSISTTAEEVIQGVDLSGKNVLVTGGYAGIGRETTRAFAKAGASVVVVGRNLAKALQAIDELKAETGNNSIRALENRISEIEIEWISLMSQIYYCHGNESLVVEVCSRLCSSISYFKAIINLYLIVIMFLKLGIPLNYLILNAGVITFSYSKTEDGFEEHFGTNVLGHFLLANLLLPALLKGAPSRVISVSSAGHCFEGIRWDDYNFDKSTFNPWLAYPHYAVVRRLVLKVSRYGQSKTGNILFAVEFTRRFKNQGVVANSLHPGTINSTELLRTLPSFSHDELLKLPRMADVMKYNEREKSIAEGAATTMYAALSPEAAKGGKFYNDCKEADAYPFASDPENAKRLWELAAKLVDL